VKLGMEDYTFGLLTHAIVGLISEGGEYSTRDIRVQNVYKFVVFRQKGAVLYMNFFTSFTCVCHILRDSRWQKPPKIDHISDFQ